MAEPTMQKLFEAGAHFGHQTQRWNPKMAPYIFTAKNKVHIIDLAKTVKKIEEAKKFIESVVKNDGKVLFVGTKKQAQDTIKKEAKKCGMPYVSERWLGGMLTNFQTIASRTKYMKDLDRKLEEGSDMTKKEKLKAKEELRKLNANLGGILDITKVPDVLYVVDVVKEATAVKEAIKIGIPIVAIVDTNVNLDLVDYPIPANDDAVKTIKMITEYIADAIAKIQLKKVNTETKKEDSSEVGATKDKGSKKEEKKDKKPAPEGSGKEAKKEK